MQQDTHKTNIQLLEELRELRQRNTELEALVSNVKVANELLKESEERYRVIADSTCDWENWVGLDGELLWVNQAVEMFTGYSQEEYVLLPDRLKQIIWDGDRDRILSLFKNGLRQRQSANDIEFQIRRKDGALKWVSVSCQPMYTETGECLGLRSSIRDISKRKLTEKALQESEEHFRRAIAEASVDAIYTVDQNGTIVFWNKAATKLFGYEENEALGRSNTMLLPKRLKEADSKARKQLLGTGVYSFKDKLNESVAVRKDGTEFPVEITISDWKANDRQYFTAILRDITERKQHEEAIKEREERFRTITESSTDAIITTDSSGKILYWNKAAEKIYGYTGNEIMGKSIELLRPEGKRLIDRKNRARFISTGHSRYIGKTVDGFAVRKDGTEFLTETSTSCWKEKGQIFFSGIVRDITERKQAEKALQQEKYFSDTVINSLPGVFYILDEQGNFIRWNKNLEAVTGYAAKELQCINNLSTIHTDDRALIASKMKDVFTNGQAEVEAKLLGRHGKVSHYLFTGIRMAIAGQTYLVGVGIDLIERKRLERKLQKSHDELEKKVKQRTAELREANEKLRISQEYLKKFAGMLLSAREEERKNISTTLHDELGSLAISVASPISVAREECKENNKQATFKALEQAQAALRKAVEDLRRLAVDLRPPNLEIVGLTAALTDYFNVIKKHSTLKITFRNDLAKKKIPEDRAIVIYRVIQETLTNITKHAKAQKVSVSLYADKSKVHLDITDDGVGFDIDKIYVKKGRLKIGITGMRERVESMGGEFSITSAPKRGTQLKVVFPK